MGWPICRRHEIDKMHQVVVQVYPQVVSIDGDRRVVDYPLTVQRPQFAQAGHSLLQFGEQVIVVKQAQD